MKNRIKNILGAIVSIIMIGLLTFVSYLQIQAHHYGPAVFYILVIIILLIATYIYIKDAIKNPTDDNIEEDPEIKKISERARVCNFTLASQRDRKGEDGKYTADFIECVLLNTFADKFVTYARKGDLIQVIGRLETTISKKSDYSRKYYKVHCDKWYLLNSASGSEPQLTEEEEKK